jgi:hypothetical protein
LLANGANPSLPPPKESHYKSHYKSHYESPLIYAIGQIGEYIELQQHPTYPEDLRFPGGRDAAKRQQFLIVRALCKAGANLGERTERSGQTPLILAAQRGETKILEELLRWDVEDSVRLHAVDIFERRTAYHWAVVRGNFRMQERLLAHGADGEVPIPLGEMIEDMPAIAAANGGSEKLSESGEV